MGSHGRNTVVQLTENWLKYLRAQYFEIGNKRKNRRNCINGRKINKRE